MKAIKEPWPSLRAIRWLSRKLNFDRVSLQDTIEKSEKPSNSLYRTGIVERNGKERRVHIPNKNLMEIQKKINKRILAKFPRHPNSFGFSGGSIEDAIRPHLGAPAIWTCDIKDAFSSIFREMIFGVFRSHFYATTSHLLILLTTLSGKLPQGAPTSPRLFDLCMRLLDREFSKIAESNGEKYSRYADNLFFSGGKEYLGGVEKEVFSWFQMAELNLHKVRVKDLNGQMAVRVLGLNIIKQKVHNTRSFKRRLRLTINHLNWLLDHGMKDTKEFEKACKKLQGQMNFARVDTLSPKLLEAYLELQKRLT